MNRIGSARLRWRWQPSLRVRLGLLVAALTVVLTAVLSLTLESEVRGSIERDAGNALAELAWHMHENLDQGMYERWLDIQKLATKKALRNPESSLAERRQVMRQLQQLYPEYAWIGLADTSCKVLAATGRLLEGRDASDRDWCSKGQLGPYVSDVHQAALLQQLLPYGGSEPLRFVDLAAPVYGNNGKLIGVLAAHLSWTWAAEVRSVFMAPIVQRDDVDVFILDRDGRVLLGSRAVPVGSALALKVIEAARDGRDGAQIQRWPDGVDYLTGYSHSRGYRSYPGLGWIVLVRKPVALAMAPARELATHAFHVGALIGLVFLAVGLVFAHLVSSPLSRLAAAARVHKDAAGGKFPIVTDYPEVRVLSQALRDLLWQLRQRERSLEALASSLESQVEARTRELAHSNASLREEVSHRRAAEAERLVLIERLETLAMSDALTGLPNRRAFVEQFDRALAASVRHGRPLSLIMIDLDHFKRINDSQGHAGGDEVLRRFGELLAGFGRAGDTVARLGGEEFAMLLQDADQARARSVAERLREATERLEIRHEGHNIRLTVSIGLCERSAELTERDALMQAADEALYRAKHQGRNRVEVHPGLNSRAAAAGLACE